MGSASCAAAAAAQAQLVQQPMQGSLFKSHHLTSVFNFLAAATAKAK